MPVYPRLKSLDKTNSNLFVAIAPIMALRGTRRTIACYGRFRSELAERVVPFLEML